MYDHIIHHIFYYNVTSETVKPTISPSDFY